MDITDILATDQFFALLQDNKPKKIGEVRKFKYSITAHKTDVECTLITFDFNQNGNADLFFFNQDILIFNAISDESYQTKMWIYEKVISDEMFPLSSKEFIDKVVEEYTFREMGFEC